MTDSETEQIVADEQSAEQRYNEQLVESARRRQGLANSRMQNTWTTSEQDDSPRSGKLIGRVRLVDASQDIEGDQFYLGTARGKADDIPVYSVWAPLFGDAFYLGGRIDHLGDIHCVRTLDRVGGPRISIFEDQVLSADPPTPLFPKRELAIPKPTARFEPVITADVQSDGRAGSGSGAGEFPTADPDSLSRAVDVAPTRAEPGRISPSERLELRAEPILLRKLASPKRGDMSPVLSTLQPDQYRAITRAASESQIFQGHPGTGKTILAVHRVAYLTSPDAEGSRADGLVMLIGPTPEYADHVRPAVRGLTQGDDENVLVISLPELFEELSGLRFDRQIDTRVEDKAPVSEELVKYLRATFSAVKRDGLLTAADRGTAVRIAYERLRADPAFPDGDVIDADWYRYLRALPPFEIAVESGALRPLLAYFGVRFRRPIVYSDVAHIIVDESQDVHPLEWEILGRLGASQGWTILGDINQRRSEHTYRSWKPVATALSIDENGKAPVIVLERGYRSTGPIMRFANRLLPLRERTLHSLQTDGPEPKIIRATQRDKLAPSAVDQAAQLIARHPEGSVAIISAGSQPIMAALRRAGWSARSDTNQVWISSAGAISLFSHDRARGLEFDAVVVVEPADFPTVDGEGRLGSLYTSLTRANKELVVVNHKALPDALQRSTITPTGRGG